MSDMVLWGAPAKGVSPYFEIIDDETWPGTAVPRRKAPFALLPDHNSGSEFEVEYLSGVSVKVGGKLGSGQKSAPTAKLDDVPPYPHYLAKIFFGGVAIFLVGVVLILAASLVPLLNQAKYVAWIILTIGSATMALTLLRAQDLDPRPK
jgi:hypothetical protein